MERADLNQLVVQLHGETLAGLDRALGRGTAILLARVGDGEHQLIAQLKRPIVTIDATLYPDRTSLRFELLRAAVESLLAPSPQSALSEAGPSGDSARLALAEAYGERTEHVMTLLERRTPPPRGQLQLSIHEALAGLQDDVALIAFDAHHLDTDARWDLRELQRPLLLVTRPDHHSTLAGADAPFYGDAQTLTLPTSTPAEWMRALTTIDLHTHPTDLEWLLDRSRGRVATTISTLELVASERSPRTAWHQAVHRSLPRAHDILALAREIHPYEPTLLLAIAEARQPYKALPDAPSARIALALRKMRSLDILEQPAPRAWQIADPLIEHAFRSMINSSHTEDLRLSV
jgi:hypothetical protein